MTQMGDCVTAAGPATIVSVCVRERETEGEKGRSKGEYMRERK